MNRRRTSLVLALLLALALSPTLLAGTGVIVTVAGTGTTGDTGTGGLAVNARLTVPYGIAVDASNNLFIADRGDNRVVRVDSSTGILTLVAGNGAAASSGDGGLATLASINLPQAVALDGAGNLYISELLGHRIRRVDAQTGIITTYAGTGVMGSSGDGGPAVSATLALTFGIALDSAGNLFIADTAAERVRRVDAQTGIIATVAGNGTNAVTPDGVPAAGASLSMPIWVALDSSGGLLISEVGAARIRRVDPQTGILSTFAGNGSADFTGDGIPAASAGIGQSAGLVVDPSGNVFFADGTGRVRRVDSITGLISTVAGNGSGPRGVCLTGGSGGPCGYWTSNNGDNGPATSATLPAPVDVAVTSDGHLLISDFFENIVRSVSLPSPYPYTNTTLAPSATAPHSGQGVLLTATVAPIGASGVPTGSVQFVQGPGTGPAVLGTAVLSGGTASLALGPLSSGTYQILAFYSGDASFNASGSPTAVVPVSSTTGPAPSISLSANLNPSSQGVTTIFTAMVNPPSGSTTVPSGPVVLYDGAAMVGSGNLVNGSATIPIVFTTMGTHSMSATYLGDSVYSQVSSAVLNVAVRGATSVTLSANPPSGIPVVLLAQVTPSWATGTMQWTEGANVLGTTSVVSGTATFPVSSLAAGSHSIQAVYSGDANYGISYSNILTVTAPAAISLTPLGPFTFGQPVTFTVSLSSSTAAGTVTLTAYNGGATLPLGTATLVGGQASLTAPSLYVGTQGIYVAYSGDGVNPPSNASFPVQVAKAAAIVTLTSSINPSTVAQYPMLTATVTPAGLYGSVQFFDGATLMGTATLNNGTATYYPAPFAVGTHSLTAVFPGDMDSTAGTSPAVSQVVNKVVSSIVLSCWPQSNPSTYGQALTFYVQVTPASATGTVQFLDGATSLGTGTISSGTAYVGSLIPTAGAHSVTAVYSGDANTTGVTSAVLVQNVSQASSYVYLTSSGNSLAYGQPVTFTAGLAQSGTSGGAWLGTGTVQFFDGATSLGTVVAAAGNLSLTVSSLAVGNHSITAVYSGDANVAGGTSSVYSQGIYPAFTSVTLASSANPSTFGQSMTFTAAVTPAAATGTVQFKDGSTLLGTATVSSGIATLTLSSLAGGGYSITALYSGSANYWTSTSSSVAQMVNKAASSVMLASSANPSAYGQIVTFTAVVSPASASGTVQFLDGTAVLGTATISGGSAALTPSGLAAGAHSITAVYNGDGNYLASTSAAVAQTVNKAASSVTLASSANPSAAGQSVTFTAAVSPAAATGTVQFLDGTTALGTAAVTSGSAALTLSALAAGAHSITAVYSGDGNFLTGTSAAVAQTVNQVVSSVTLTSSVNPSTAGQTVVFTATVSPASATGTVQFLEDGALLITGALNGSGIATLGVAVNPGTHTFTAVYSGDANDTPSTSAVVVQTVNKAASSVTLASSVNPSAAGQSVTFTAAVSPAAATGTVQFLDGAASLGTAAVGSGSATLAISTLAAGAHSITAVYGGDSTYLTGTSAAVAQTVNKAASSVTLASSVNPSAAGQSVTFTAAVSPAAATGTVQFLDGAASLGTAAVGSGSATLAISTLAAGAHSITAVYSGSATYLTSTSAAVAQTVNKAASSVTLASSVNPSAAGQSVTFTAAVSPAAATGTVQFLDGAASLGTATVASGSATLAISTLAVGAHSITAVYGGSATYLTSTSAAVAQTVNKAASSVTLTSSVNPSTAGQSVTFTATVSPAAATGTVQFLDGAASLGTAPVASGSAALALSTLASGVHSITGVYSGATNYAGSTSAAVNQTVLPGAPTKLTAAAASSAQINLAWTASPTSGVTYNVYSSTSSGFTPSGANRIATGLTATSYSNTGLSPSTTHYYLVTAQNSAGESAVSNQASATTAAGLSCHVAYSVTSQWNNGFGAALTIKNTGSAAIGGWNLTWTWPGNQQITQSWNASYTQKGANASLTNASYNGTIAAGATVSGIGFNASYSGTNPAPPAFSVNGTLCK